MWRISFTSMWSRRSNAAWKIETARVQTELIQRKGHSWTFVTNAVSSKFKVLCKNRIIVKLKARSEAPCQKLKLEIFWREASFRAFSFASLRCVLNLLGQIYFCSLSGHNWPKTVNDRSLEPPNRVLCPQHWDFRYLKNHRFFGGFSVKLSDFDIF